MVTIWRKLRNSVSPSFSSEDLSIPKLQRFIDTHFSFCRAAAPPLTRPFRLSAVVFPKIEHSLSSSISIPLPLRDVSKGHKNNSFGKPIQNFFSTRICLCDCFCIDGKKRQVTTGNDRQRQVTIRRKPAEFVEFSRISLIEQLT